MPKSHPYLRVMYLGGVRFRYWIFKSSPDDSPVCLEKCCTAPCFDWYIYTLSQKICNHFSYHYSWMYVCILFLYPMLILHSFMVSMNIPSTSWLSFMTILTSCKTFKSSLFKEKKNSKMPLVRINTHDVDIQFYSILVQKMTFSTKKKCQQEVL